MNQSTDPLLIELAKAAYICPVARAALHDYWEDRGGQPLALRRESYWDSEKTWHRLLSDSERFGVNWWDILPVASFEETEFQADVVWERSAPDLLAGQLQVPRSILHGPIS